MRITEILWRFNSRFPKGNIWSGKFKLHKKVTPLIKAKKIVELEVEEKNMFYLRHPYLTVAQTKGHAVSFNHKKKFFEKHYEKKLNWKDHELLGNRFGFLKIADSWE